MSEWIDLNLAAYLEWISWLTGVALLSTLGLIGLRWQRHFAISSQARVSLIRAALLSTLILPVALWLFPAPGVFQVRLNPGARNSTDPQAAESSLDPQTGWLGSNSGNPKQATPWPALESLSANGVERNEVRPPVLPQLPASLPARQTPPSETESLQPLPIMPVAARNNQAGSSSHRWSDWSMWMMAVWCLGSLYYLVRLFTSWLTTIRLRQQGVEQAAYQPSLAAGDHKTISPTKVNLAEIRFHQHLRLPMVVGVWRPAILLPIQFKDWDRERQQMVLEHELAHLDRHDVAWQLLSAITICVYWWLLPLRGLAGNMRLEQELVADDRVLLRGFSPARYAQALLELAQGVPEEMSCPMAVTMASPPLEHRVRSLLDPAVPRGKSSPSGLLATVMAFFALLVGLVLLRPVPSIASVASGSRPEITVANPMPNSAAIKPADSADQLTCRVEDQEGNPITDATVKFRLVSLNRQTSTGPQLIREETVSSDDRGLFAIELPKNAQRPVQFTAFVSCDAYAGRVVFRNIKPADESIQAIVLQPGRKVTGRLIDADTKQPIEDAAIGVFAVLDESGIGVSFTGGINQTPQGEFAVWVSQTGAHRLNLQSPNHCPESKTVFSDQSELGDIELQTGAAVQGQLVDLQDRPIAGAVVQLSSLQRDDPPGWPNAVKTDDQGRFRFPPRQPGDYVVECLDSAMGLGNRWLRSVEDLPIIPPQTVSIEGQSKSKSIALQAIPAITLTGKAQFEDGRPAAGVMIVASLFLAGGHVGYELDRVFSNEQGIYQLEVPQQSPDEQRRISVSSMSTHEFDDTWFRCRSRILPSSEAFERVAVQPNLQAFSLKDSSIDLDGVDWVLRPREVQPDQQQTATPRTSSELLKAWAEFSLVRADLSQEQQRQRLLDFEKEYRGHPKAAIALFRAINTSPSIDAEQLQPLFDLVLDHYLGLDVLDVEILSFGDMFAAEPSLKFLRATEQRSPSRRIQATACYAQAESLAMTIKYRQVMEDSDWRVRTERQADDGSISLDTIDLSKSEQPYFQSLYRKLSEVDLQQTSQALTECLDRLQRDYPDIKTIENVYYLDGEVHRIEPTKKSPTLNERASRLRFQKFLNSGQPVPNIVGTDLRGHEFSLERFRGSPVLLIFTGQLSNDQLNRIRAIQQLYLPQRLEVVMVTDCPRNRIEQQMAEGLVSWTVCYDDDVGNPIKRWAVGGNGDLVYLIDPQGELKKQLILESPLESILEDHFESQ